MSSALPIPVIAPARPAPTRAELERAFAEFLRLDVAAGDAAPATVRSYRAEAEAWVRWCEAKGIDPAAATVAHIKLFRAELVERGYQPVTIGWKLTVVRRFYEAARSAGLRPDNPVAGVRPPRVRRAADDFKYLTADQLARLLAAVPGPDEATGVEQIKRLRDQLMLSLMALHGLRTVEVHRASLEDLTERGGYTALLARGKSGQRLLFLRPDTGEILARYLELRGEMPRDELGTPLFVALDRGFKGHRLSRRHIRAITDHYLHAAGLKRAGISCHALRHTAATRVTCTPATCAPCRNCSATPTRAPPLATRTWSTWPSATQRCLFPSVACESKHTSGPVGHSKEGKAQGKLRRLPTARPRVGN